MLRIIKIFKKKKYFSFMAVNRHVTKSETSSVGAIQLDANFGQISVSVDAPPAGMPNSAKY